MCQHEGRPLSEARIFTAHTADDRIENFTCAPSWAPVRAASAACSTATDRGAPLLDITRDELHDYLSARESAGRPCIREVRRAWREGRHQRHTDRFRAYVRHKIVPVARNGTVRCPRC